MKRTGVKYYNDSIASSPSRTIAGLHSFQQKLVLIAGGYDKKIPFDVLGPEICAHVRLLILCGATAEKIEAAVCGAPEYRPGQPEILHAKTLAEAVQLAHAHQYRRYRYALARLRGVRPVQEFHGARRNV